MDKSVEKRPAGAQPIEVQVGQLFTVALEPEGSLNEAIRGHRENHFGGVFLGRGNLKSVDQVRRLAFRAQVQAVFWGPTCDGRRQRTGSTFPVGACGQD